MNDMTWGGGNGGDAAPAAGGGGAAGAGVPGRAAADAVRTDGSALARAVETNPAVREALERMIASQQRGGLDEVELASGLLWAYVGDMERRWQEVEKIENAKLDRKVLKEVVGHAADVREAVTMLAAERGKVDKLRKDVAGAVGGGSLDLDAARDEIGRRLACLRRAGAG